MIKNICSFVLVLFLFFSNGILHAQIGHDTKLFNKDWRFHLGDLDTTLKDYDTATWRPVTLPHDWSREGPFSKELASATGYAPGGIGWYIKDFTTQAKKDQRTFIYFDGVYENSEVWINGHLLGKRPNGFISFQYELTKFLKPNGKNTIIVRVDHSQYADSRWYSGSGIYRNVYLITTNAVHIGLWGVAFTTPVAEANKAVANVNVSVVNSSRSKSKVEIKCNLVNVNGVSIAEDDQSLKLKKGDTADAKLNFTVKNPKLWSVDTPNLYNLVVTVTSKGKVLDKWEKKVGIRNIKFDANNGFFLNGKNMKLKGVCIHEDAGVFGVAVPKEVWRRRLKILKSAGVNSVRMAHNPHADYFYDLCDELGILVMDESFDEWAGAKRIWLEGWNHGKPGKDGYHEYFKDWGIRDVSDMVLRSRNHPSIIMWSIGNEIDYPGDPFVDSARADAEHPSINRLSEDSRELVAAVKKYDSSRPVTAALAGLEQSNKTAYPFNLDIVGYNYQENRYEKDHELYPNRVIYGSENSKQLYAWTAVEKHKYIAGQYVWTGIDFLGEAHNWPNRSSGTGLLNMAGFPKAEYYFRQSLWLDTPMIKILTADVPKDPKSEPYPKAGISNWNYQSGRQVRVYCYTNCADAELFLNGQSMGKLKPKDFDSHVIHWDIDYQPGELVVKGTSLKGKSFFDTLRTSGPAYALNATSDVKVLNGKTKVAQIVINVVDKDGLPVGNADNDVTVEVNGSLKLLGLENGALNNMDDYRSPNKRVLNGKLLAYIGSQGKTGSGKIIIKAKGLKPATLTIHSLAEKK